MGSAVNSVTFKCNGVLGSWLGLFAGKFRESILVRCVLPACADHMCVNSHQMSASVWGCPEVNKFEQVFSDGHPMSLAGGPVQWSCI